MFFHIKIILLIIITITLQYSCMNGKSQTLEYEEINLLLNHTEKTQLAISTINNKNNNKQLFKLNRSMLTRNNTKKIERCYRIYTRYTKNIKQLYKYLPNKIKLQNIQVTQFSKNDCLSIKARKKLIIYTLNFLKQKKSSISFILPEFDYSSYNTSNFLEGYKSALDTARHKVSLLIYPIKITKRSILQVLAQTIFVDKPTIINTYANGTISQLVSRWAKLLNFPVVLIKSKPLNRRQKNIFTITPTLNSLISRLAQITINKNLLNVAILDPIVNGLAYSRAADLFIKEFTKLGGKITKIAQYLPQNYNSMDYAIKNIVNLKQNERVDEYNKLLNQEKDLAIKEGRKFNSSNVYLKPEIDFNAIFVPENFVAAKAFSKLLPFNGVENYTLIGLHTWRALDLLNPVDKNLQSSFFVDFIKPYNTLNKKIRPRVIYKNNFTSVKEATILDNKYFGFQAGLTMNMITAQKETDRYKLYASIKNLKQKQDSYSDVFDYNNNFIWPIYSYGIDDDEIFLENN